MIDFSKIYEVYHSLVTNRLDPLKHNIPIIQARTTGSKPTGIFATVDINLVSDKAGYTTYEWFDSTTDEMVIETHKDIRIQLSVRNGSPDNLDNQMQVFTMGNYLHKAFTETPYLEYLSDNLKATVTNVEPVRSTYDTFGSGFGNVVMFNMNMGMVDITRYYQTPIQRVKASCNFGDVDTGDVEGKCISIFNPVYDSDKVIVTDITDLSMKVESSAITQYSLYNRISTPREYYFEIELEKMLSEDYVDIRVMGYKNGSVPLLTITNIEDQLYRVSYPDNDLEITIPNNVVGISISNSGIKLLIEDSVYEVLTTVTTPIIEVIRAYLDDTDVISFHFDFPNGVLNEFAKGQGFFDICGNSL